MELLRKNVNLVKVEDKGTPPSVLKELSSKSLASYSSKRLIFEKQEPKTKIFPAESSVFEARSEKVAEVWLKILDIILRFGRISTTQYADDQQEVYNLVAVVTNEDPKDFCLPEYLLFTKEQLEKYIPTVTTAFRDQDSAYNYGDRIFSYFGRNQVEDIVEKLIDQPYTRSAIICLWDSEHDNLVKDCPCINHIEAKIIENRLYLTTVIRSNDMFEGWPENAFALKVLQNLILKKLKKKGKDKFKNLTLGDLVTVSQSAHLYGDCWDSARRVIEKNYTTVVGHPCFQQDPRGNFVISLLSDEDEVQVEHIAPNGESLQIYKGRTAQELFNKLSKNQAVSLLSHAFYLGAELEKAEIALKKDYLTRKIII